MQEYNMEVKKTVLQMIVWAALVCASAWMSGQSGRIAGFVVGFLTSMTYLLLMCYRIKRSADMPVHKAVVYMRTGLMLRLLFVVLMLYLSVKLPWIDFWSSVIGLFSLYVILLYNTFTNIIRNGNPNRKG